jgi:hypothetical protein
MKFSIEAQALKDSARQTQAKRRAVGAKTGRTNPSTQASEFTWDISEDRLAPGMKRAAEKDEKRRRCKSERTI